MLNVIKTERAYEDALERVYALMQLDPAEDSTESDELDALALFVEDYERRHYPIAPPTPIEAITLNYMQRSVFPPKA